MDNVDINIVYTACVQDRIQQYRLKTPIELKEVISLTKLYLYFCSLFTLIKNISQRL